MRLGQQTLNEIQGDIKLAAREVFRCYTTKVRDENPKSNVDAFVNGGLPFRTGDLRTGIQLTTQTHNDFRSTAIIESTQLSDKGFDYPSHLDISHPKHGGWWRSVNKQQMLEECVREVFPRFNL